MEERTPIDSIQKIVLALLIGFAFLQAVVGCRSYTKITIETKEEIGRPRETPKFQPQKKTNRIFDE